MALKSDPSGSIEFLKVWQPNGPWVLTFIEPEGVVFTRTFGPADVASGALKQQLLSIEGKANVYFMVNVAKQRLDKKAKKTDISHAIALHVDLDPRKAEDRDSERVRIRQQLQSFDPKPSFIIDSGNGYQAFWMLKKQFDVIGEEAKWLELERYNKQLGIELGGDNTHNIERIMRLPGTINVPNKAKREKGYTPVLAKLVSSHPNHAYELSAFQQATTGKLIARQLPEQKSKGKKPKAVSMDDLEALKSRPIEKINIDELTGVVPEYALRILKYGPDSQPKKYPTRSEALFAAVCALVRAKVIDHTIYSILLDKSLRISEHIYDQADPKASAIRNIRSAHAACSSSSSSWPGGSSRDGFPRSGYRNALEALSRLGLKGELDVFRNRLQLSGYELQQFQGEMTDFGTAYLRRKINTAFGFDPGKDAVNEAAIGMCVENQRDPICEYLKSLQWDGVRRVDKWLTNYLKAANTRLNGAIGQIVLIAAVRRAIQPGCKFDHIMVLEGSQGLGKSSALHILAGGDQYFSDQPILDKDDRSQAEALEGVWICELCELAGMRKADIDKVKGFASRTTDRARPAYGRFRVDNKRRCIIVATTNEQNYLRDPTGDRRFWPVAVGKIDLVALRRDRDQLWAEAVHMESLHKGALTISEDLWPAAAVEQEARKEIEDPWLLELENLLQGRDSIAGNELWHSLHIPMERRKQPDNKRIGACMKQLGFVRTKSRFNPGQSPRWGYVRSNTAIPQTMTVVAASRSTEIQETLVGAVTKDPQSLLRAELGLADQFPE